MEMKMKNILKYFGLLTVALLLTSCEDYLDVNTDPNNPTSVSPDLVLPVGHKYTGQLMQQDRRISHLGNMFMYNWSQSDGFSWYTDEFKYNVTSSFYRNIFRLSYSQALKQYQILSQLEGPENENYRAIGIVMKAFHFQLLVDMYGDVPYSEAWRVLDEYNPDNITPAYDSQEDIYADLLAILAEAAADIDPAAPFYKNDMLFDGNLDLWVKFANSLRLRLAVRSGNETMVVEIIKEGNLMSAADENIGVRTCVRRGGNDEIS